jgi:hypothetical protein
VNFGHSLAGSQIYVISAGSRPIERRALVIPPRGASLGEGRHALDLKLGAGERAERLWHARADRVHLCIEIGQQLLTAGVGARIDLIGPAREFLHALGDAAARQPERPESCIHLAVDRRHEIEAQLVNFIGRHRRGGLRLQ